MTADLNMGGFKATNLANGTANTDSAAFGQVRPLYNQAYAEYTAWSGGITSVIGIDDTIPQVTEGFQLLSATITPTSASNKIEIMVLGNATQLNGDGYHIAAIFVNGAANAVASTAVTCKVGYESPVALFHEYTPGSTSAQTITVRVGTNNSAVPTIINGYSTRFLGGTQKYILKVREIPA